MISSGCYEFVAPWCGPFLDAALNLKNAIGIGASLAARPSHTTVHTGPYTAIRQVKR